MLKGIPTLISPDLLRTLHQMGHGDELVLADAHFPGESLGRRVLRADGLLIPSLLDAILTLLELDDPGTPLTMMQPEDAAHLDPKIEADYMAAVHGHAPSAPPPIRVARHSFYEQAGRAFAVLLTGDTRPYGNIILRKGVTPPQTAVRKSGVTQ